MLVPPSCASVASLRPSTILRGPQPCFSKRDLLSLQSPETWSDLRSAPAPCFHQLRLQQQLPPQSPAAAAAPAWSEAVWVLAACCRPTCSARNGPQTAGPAYMLKAQAAHLKLPALWPAHHAAI